jgi:hypothetical protein
VDVEACLLYVQLQQQTTQLWMSREEDGVSYGVLEFRKFLEAFKYSLLRRYELEALEPGLLAALRLHNCLFDVLDNILFYMYMLSGDFFYNGLWIVPLRRFYRA